MIKRHTSAVFGVRELLAGLAVVGCAGLARAQCSPTEVQKLVASNPTESGFYGWWVAVDGDTMIVGAFGDSTAAPGAGAAYVYVRSGNTWVEQAVLTASDAEAGDNFGVFVTLSGDVAVIGAYFDEHSGTPYAGSAYVFERSGGSWTERAKLTASDPETDSFFGTVAVVDGPTIVVGAYLDDNEGGVDAGAAYVYERPPTGWTSMTETQKLAASDAAAGDEFGAFGIRIRGKTMVIGAWHDDYPGAANAGSAYIFERSGGAWAERAKLTPSDPCDGAEFASHLTLGGDDVIIGAWRDCKGGAEAGAVYFFERPAGGWASMTETSQFTSSDIAAGDLFGSSVAVDGGTLVVGAATDDNDGGEDAGSAYIFSLNGGSWVETAKITASDAEAGDNFGWLVGVEGDTVVSTAFLDDVSGLPDAGSAYVFELAGCGGCYADCDQSTGAGSLDFFDFVCFQDAFSAADPYACGCDETTGPAVCDFFDFVCFQDAFSEGC